MLKSKLLNNLSNKIMYYFPMISLITYGSLINKQELQNKNIPLDRCIPIVLSGFKREFSQEPSWRKNPSNDRAVLTAIPQKNHQINGILINNISNEELLELDHRERGYKRIRVNIDHINFKYTNKSFDLDQVYIYIGKKENYNNSLGANKEYLKICIDGAKSWSKGFYGDFLDTTYTQGVVLKS